jgi:hypothetical protein
MFQADASAIVNDLLLRQANNTEKFCRSNDEDESELFGDTSQHNNWENFRNETFNGEAVMLSTKFWDDIDEHGKLEFDYVSTARPGENVKPVSARRFVQLLASMGLLVKEPDEDAMVRELEHTAPPGSLRKVGCNQDQHSPGAPARRGSLHSGLNRKVIGGKGKVTAPKNESAQLGETRITFRTSFMMAQLRGDQQNVSQILSV